ncbi:hypothetical protein Ait01nite_081870 [Actinoplanes italicus]|uniref:WD40 repeat protein n=1 Tax=Actinoplanes italicus TaxID=113567 RepID=A0A2T0K361_9ACTN|nr:WD40 repeat protein [Actinoplanes italicus]GIE35142.1 hypothetical protein Ait01nite_081870 [Actinoplanes italicus]
MDADSGRRALVIGVGSFPADSEFDDLPFAVGLAGRLADVLTGYRTGGFDVRALYDPDRDEIAAAVQELLDDASCAARIIHLISHGRPDEQADRVELIGRCARRGNNVREWVSRAQSDPVPTLFLVDLCGAGRATRLQFNIEPRQDEVMAWVLAGARGDELAYDGAFTRAAVRVLEDCARDGLGTDPRLRYVSLREVARRINDGLSGQSLWTTPVPLHYDAALPVLPNPRYERDPVADRIATFDAPIQPFLTDVVADAAHFQTRAGMYFTGRRAVLDSVVPWLDGAGPGGLWVLTGAAGSGKSAILGALVCAAHPALQELTAHVRLQMDDPPAVNPLLVAVHARQRTLLEILASIGRQLGLKPPDQGWTAAALIAALAGMDSPPTLIIDALDECPEADAVQTVLLMPMARARRHGSGLAVRLLVGTRPWRDRFTPLLEHAQESGQFSDLDQLDRREIYRDLRRYLIELLSGIPQLEILAGGIATRLADDYNRRRHEPAASRWGHFLVAARYAGYIRDHPPGEKEGVAELLAAMPIDLPQVLEMELAAHPRPHHLRAALAALAFAKGDGMPTELLRVVAAALGPADPELFLGDEVRLYLRTSCEPDGVSLLRLYHQGLADYLRVHPISAAERNDLVGPVAAALLRTRDTADGSRSWEFAPDYLLRHAVQHATDAGIVDQLLTDMDFLSHADAEPLLAELHHGRSAAGRLWSAVYRSVHHLLNTDALTRHRLIDLAARRYGALGSRMSPTRRRAGIFQPRWVTGSQLHPALQRTLRAGAARVLACTTVNGRAIAVVGGIGGTVRVWDVASGEFVGPPLRSGTGRTTALECVMLAGRPAAVVGNADGTVQVWDLMTGEPVGAPLVTSPPDVPRSVHTQRRVTAVACTELEGRPIAVVGSADDRLRIWDLSTGTAVASSLQLRPAEVRRGVRTRRWVTAMACGATNGRPVAVVGGADGSVTLWDLAAGESLVVQPPGGRDLVSAAACCVLDSVPVAITGCGNRWLKIWRLDTGEPVGATLDIGIGQITTLVCTILEGRPVAVVSRAAGIVQVWDLAGDDRVRAPFAAHSAPVESVACTVLDSGPVAVTGGLDGTVRVWDLAATESVGNPLEGHARPVTTVTSTLLGEQQVVLSGSSDGTVQIRDLATGDPIGTPLRRTGRVTAVACGMLDGRPIVVVGTRNGTAQVWDLATGDPIGAPLVSGTRRVGAVACMVLRGRPVAITGDRAVRIWDLATGEPLGSLAAGLKRQVTALLAVELAGGPAVFAGIRDGAVRGWDLATGDPIGVSLSGGTDRVTALAAIDVDGAPVAVVGTDRAVHLWDLATGEPLGNPLRAGRGTTSVAAAIMDGRPVAAIGSRRGAVSVWDLRDRFCIDRWLMWDGASAVAFSPDGRRLIAGAGWDLAVFAPQPEGQE